MFVKCVFGVILVLAFQGVIFAADEVENLFKNPSFEEGTAGWSMDQDAGTAASFIVDNKEEAIDGDQTMLVTIDAVGGWGSQFGQKNLIAGEKGKEYTFAVFAKSLGGPVTVNLQIERPVDPWDRAARSNDFTLKDDEWMELNVTFTVNVDFPQGWFAYISCGQAKVAYVADMFQLYEGEYVPFEALGSEKSVSASANDLITTWGSVKE